MSTFSGWTLGPPSSAILGAWTAQPESVAGVMDSYYTASARERRVTWYDASLEEQLSRISELGDNWDGYGAASVDGRIIESTRSIMDMLDIPPDVLIPNASGTVTLEWESPLGRASLEVGIDTFGFYTAPNAGTSIFLGGSIRGLEVGDINFAVSTIAGEVIPYAMESGDWDLGVESRNQERASAY